MDITTIILACIGSTGVFSLIQFLLARYFNRKDGKDEIKGALKTLTERANTGDLNDSRIQLLMLINHFPHDHRAILTEAENYFIKLQGDSWMIEIITKWAEEENVDIEPIKRAHEITLAKNRKED